MQAMGIEGVMTVRHTIEDSIEGISHVVRIYGPTGHEFKIGRWPVTEEDTSLRAIWNGVFEAGEYSHVFGKIDLAVFSTDEEAFAAYCAEVDVL